MTGALANSAPRSGGGTEKDFEDEDKEMPKNSQKKERYQRIKPGPQKRNTKAPAARKGPNGMARRPSARLTSISGMPTSEPIRELRKITEIHKSRGLKGDEMVTDQVRQGMKGKGGGGGGTIEVLSWFLNSFLSSKLR